MLASDFLILISVGLIPHYNYGFPFHKVWLRVLFQIGNGLCINKATVFNLKEKGLLRKVLGTGIHFLKSLLSVYS